ncbi:MAG: DUF72 domain-containing protein [Chitinophagaceae bacterium]|nr:DUF72 domain-containing protein [Chitinophagaceae bacterium]
MKAIKWHIGCSGFYYREWKGGFYPEKLPQKQWFEFYAAQFNTLELNVTFYRFPQLSDLERWEQKSPPNFSFSVKAPRLITHYKQFNECKDLLDDFYDTVQKGLKEKLGIILFQLPPSFAYSKEKLDRLVQSLRSETGNAVEFRHSSWWRQEVFETLSAHKIIFCGISYPGLPDQVVANHPIAYYRFHGLPKLYSSAYSHMALKEAADSLLKNKNLEEVFLYFNNTASMNAIENARWINAYVSENILNSPQA